MLSKKDIESVSAKVKEFLIEKGYDDKFEKDHYVAAVEKHLEDTLAEAILEEEIESSPNDLLVAKLKKDEVHFVATSDSKTPLPQKNDEDNSNKVKKRVKSYIFMVCEIV